MPPALLGWYLVDLADGEGLFTVMGVNNKIFKQVDKTIQIGHA